MRRVNLRGKERDLAIPHILDRVEYGSPLTRGQHVYVLYLVNHEGEDFDARGFQQDLEREQ